MKRHSIFTLCYRLNRCMSTVTANESQASRSYKPPPAVIKRFQDCESYDTLFTFTIPYLLHKKNVTPKVAYCLDEKIALTVYKTLKDRIFNNPAPIIEVNPGIGLLTRHLASRAEELGVKLLAVETSDLFRITLMNLENKHPGFKVYNDEFFQWPRNWYDSARCPARDGGFLQEIKPREWTDVTAYKIVGVLPGTSFLRHFLNGVILKGGIASYGRPELLTVLDSRTYTNLIKNRKAMQASGLGTAYLGALAVLFDLVFDYETLLELDATGFLPWMSQSPSCRFDPTKMYLISATPKLHILDGLEFDDYRHFLFFLRQISHRRLRVIPYFENWLPGSGPRFIAEGFDVFTEFRSLSSQNLLDMFKLFISLPLFKSCPFLVASDEFMLVRGESHDKLGLYHEEVEEPQTDEK